MFLSSHDACAAFVLNPTIPSGVSSPFLRKNDRQMERTNTSTPFFATRDGGELDFNLLEKQMIAKHQEKLDVKRVMDVVLGEESTDGSGLLIQSTKKSSDGFEIEDPPDSPFNVALAAGSAVGLTSLAAFHAPMILSLGAFAATTYVAQRDPIQDEDLVEGDLTGPLSRMIGRATLTSIEKAIPALQTVARASVAQFQLKSKYQELQKENQELKMKLDPNPSKRDVDIRNVDVDVDVDQYTIARWKETQKDEIAGTYIFPDSYLS